MAVAGTLAVNIIARTEKFQKGVAKARDSITSLKRVVGTANRAMGMFGGILGGVSAAGMVKFAKSTVDSVDRLSKLSEQIDTTTEELSLLTFQADLAGASQEQLATGLKRMSRTLVDARSGLTSALRPFERLNLNTEELLQMDPGKAFQAIAGAISSMENPLEKSATAMEIFGRSGAELIPLFDSDLAGAARQFERIGGAVSTEDADNVVKFKDALTEMSVTINAIGRSAFFSLLPQLLDAIKGAEVIMEDLGIIGRPDPRTKRRGTPFVRQLSTGLGEFAVNFFRPVDSARYGLVGAQGQNMGQFQTTLALEESTRIQREQLEIMRQQQTSPAAGGVTIEPATFE